MEDELPPQALVECPVCKNDVVVQTFVVGVNGVPSHTEFTYKCFSCGFARSSPERFL